MIIPCVNKSDTMSDLLTQGNNCNRKYQNRQRIKGAGKDRIQRGFFRGFILRNTLKALLNIFIEFFFMVIVMLMLNKSVPWLNKDAIDIVLRDSTHTLFFQTQVQSLSCWCQQ